jgi:hypothetical protein
LGTAHLALQRSQLGNPRNKTHGPNRRIKV